MITASARFSPADTISFFVEQMGGKSLAAGCSRLQRHSRRKSCSMSLEWSAAWWTMKSSSSSLSHLPPAGLSKSRRSSLIAFGTVHLMGSQTSTDPIPWRYSGRCEHHRLPQFGSATFTRRKLRVLQTPARLLPYALSPAYCTFMESGFHTGISLTGYCWSPQQEAHQCPELPRRRICAVCCPRFIRGTESRLGS